MHGKPMITREQLAALRQRAERDSHEISLSATELLFGILFLVMGLLQVAGLEVEAVPVWLTLIGIALLLYMGRRLHRHYERQLGKVKPLTAGRPYDLIILMLFVALAVEAVTAVWLERSHPLLAEALRTSGFPFHFVLWMGLGLYLPLGVYLRIWRWVGATLWCILGLGALFVGLPALGIPRFVMLSFLIPGVGYTLSGLLFLRSERKRMRELTAREREAPRNRAGDSRWIVNNWRH